jgi:hypothetical protein
LRNAFALMFGFSLVGKISKPGGFFSFFLKNKLEVSLSSKKG